MILNNPFHTLGLVANCSKREETRRGSQIKRYLEVGKPLVFQDDLYFPGCRRNAITVESALTGIQDARDRIGPGLFWFTRGASIDESAIGMLHSGDLHGALAIWQRVEGNSVELESASSINNLGTVSLLIALSGRSPGQELSGLADRARMGHLRRGLKAKVRLLQRLRGPDLSSFCASFSDEIATQDPDKITDIFVESLELFKEEAESHGLELPTRTLVSLLDTGGSRAEALRQRFAVAPRQELERAIRQCASAYKQEPSQALAAGRQLMKVAREQLPDLINLVSASDFVYTSLADRVARELLDAAVQYHNHQVQRDTDSDRVASASAGLVKNAFDVACGSATRARAQENLETLNSIIQRQAMKPARAALEAWIEGAMEQLDVHSSPRHRITFVRRALGESESGNDSAISLLKAFRDQGVQLLGPRFQSSDEMVQYGAIVCSILVKTVVSAYNAAIRKSVASDAAQTLMSIDRFFGEVSRQRSWDGDSFPINELSAKYLASNRMAALQHLIDDRSYGGMSQTPSGSTGKGCLGMIVFLVGVIALLVSVTVGLIT